MPKTTKYDTEIKNARKEIADFFGFHLENIEITVAKNRTEYEKLLDRKTADWEIGNANSNKKTILLLDPARWKKEAPSHKLEEFPFLIKHELIHIYTNHLSNSKTLPMWLIEGLAGVISGQYKNSKVKYFEANFCGKLDTLYNWNRFRNNLSAYPTAYLFTHYIIDKYGFKKIKQLIKSSSIYYSYYRFNKIVINIFGKNLTELEKEFLDVLQ